MPTGEPVAFGVSTGEGALLEHQATRARLVFGPTLAKEKEAEIL